MTYAPPLGLDDAPRHAMIVVGQSNPYGDNPAMALYIAPSYATGARLYRLAAAGVRDATGEVLTDRKWLAIAQRFNLCIGVWRDGDARSRATEILAVRRGRPMLLLGRRVADSFPAGLPGVWTIPHPSGRNRAYSQPGTPMLAAARIYEAMRAALAPAGIPG